MIENTKNEPEKKETNNDFEERANRRHKILFVTSLIVLIITFISVFKLSSYINEPKTLFNATVEEVFNDFNSSMSNISNNKFYML